MFALAGWCNECAAMDLLFARELSSGRVFFVCAACATAGTKSDDLHLKISDAIRDLAPEGWTLATRDEVEAAGLGEGIAGDAPESYADVIAWYPGFQKRVR